MSLTEINIREKEFHDKLQSQKKGRFENIFYKALYNINKDFFFFFRKKCQKFRNFRLWLWCRIFDRKSYKIQSKKNCWNRYLRSFN